MNRFEEDAVMRREYELWEAARELNHAGICKYLASEVNVVYDNFHCYGEEYVMLLPTFGLLRYSIERYQEVAAERDLIQNYYLVNLKIAGSDEVKICQVTSTWKRVQSEWKIVFHMRTLIS